MQLLSKGLDSSLLERSELTLKSTKPSSAEYYNKLGCFRFYENTPVDGVFFARYNTRRDTQHRKRSLPLRPLGHSPNGRSHPGAQMKATYADYLLEPVPHSEFRAQVRQ